MISYIQGTVLAKQKDTVMVLTTGGVGYDVHMSLLSVSACHIGQDVSLYTYMKVSENGMALYGFEHTEKRAFFMQLLSVKSVGPKSAMNILSLGSVDDIKAAIVRGDATYLSAVQGLGKKTAERLVVELKSKIAVSKNQPGVDTASGDILSDVIDALVSMGYSKEEAKQRVQLLSSANKTTEQLLKEALSH